MGCSLTIRKRNLKVQEKTSLVISFGYCKNLPESYKTIKLPSKSLPTIYEAKPQLEYSSTFQ